MKTNTKRLLVLLLCLLMSGVASSALAAAKVSKTFTTAPTIKVTLPRRIESYDDEDYNVTLSQPGFMTVRLLDESGFELAVLMDHVEVHSKGSEFELVAVDGEGNPLPLGKYKLTFDLVNQFGVSAKTLEKTIEVIKMSDYRMEAYLQDLAKKHNVSPSTAAATLLDPRIVGDLDINEILAEMDEPSVTLAVGPAVTGPAVGPAVTGPAADTAAAVTDAAVPAAPAVVVALPTNEVTYTAGSSVTGDEGLLIGVGVGDIATQADSGYWGLSAASTDEQIWAALTREMVGVDVAENESAYIYDSPYEGRHKLGTVSGISQGLNVIVKREDGWALVETFRNEDGAFIRGYIKSNKLRPVKPNQTYGIVVDKTAQTLTVFKDGARLGSCKVATGLPTPKYLHRETPAGEFITVTRRGSYDYYGMGFSDRTIRINGNYYLCEVPTTKKNGTKYLEIANQLGNKASRGNIVIAYEPSTDGGICADWIWDMTTNNKKVKVLVFDDKARTDVPVSAK